MNFDEYDKSDDPHDYKFVRWLTKEKVGRENLKVQHHAGFSLRIEVAGGYCRITGESGNSEKNLTSSFYRLIKFNRKFPCSSRRILRSLMLNEHPDHGLCVLMLQTYSFCSWSVKLQYMVKHLIRELFQLFNMQLAMKFQPSLT